MVQIALNADSVSFFQGSWWESRVNIKLEYLTLSNKYIIQHVLILDKPVGSIRDKLYLINLPMAKLRTDWYVIDSIIP